MNEIELALERSRRYVELARGFWRPGDLTPRPPSLKRKGENSPPPSREGLEERSAEYDRLFCHRTTILCPIYEVEYDKNRAVSQGPTLADIAGFYRAFGLERALNERPDHLAFELEFMSVLAYKEALALQKDLREQAEICRDAQKKFLEAHLGRWVGIFTDTLAQCAQLEFYKALAAELREFIESECSRLGVHPEIITERPVEREDARCPMARVLNETLDA